MLVDSDIARFYASPVTNPHYFGDLLGNAESEAQLSPVLGTYMADTLFVDHADKPAIAPEHFREVTRAALNFAELGQQESKDALAAVDKTDKETLNSLAHSLQGDSQRDHEASLMLFLSALGIGKQAPPSSILAELLAYWITHKLAQPVPLESPVSSEPSTVDRGSTLRWPRLDNDSAIAQILSWKNRIQLMRRKFGVSLRDDRNDLADARVMTALQLVNRDWKVKKRRVHLLTGSPVLHVTALCDWQLREGGLSHELAADFFRHPTYVLSEDELWLPIQSTSTKSLSRSLSDVVRRHAAVEWLIRRPADGSLLNLRNHRHLHAMSFLPVMLGEQTEQSLRRFKRMATLSETPSSTSPGDSGNSTLHRKFASVLKNNISQILAGELGRSARIVITRNRLADTNKNRRTRVQTMLAKNDGLDIRARLADLLETIASEHRKTFTSGFFAASLALLEPHFVSGRDRSLRGVPFIMFSNFGEARKYSDLLLRKRPASDDELSDQRQKVIAEDQSCYCLVLVHALSSAAYNDWSFAAKAAQYAFTLAKSSSLNVPRPAEVGGEEASYLRAVCLRHIARNVADLKRASDELSSAEALFINSDVRITAERFALRLTGWCFRFYAQGGTSQRPNDDERRLPSDITYWLVHHAKLDSKVELEEDRKRVSVELQMLSNLSISLLMLRFDSKGLDNPSFPRDLPRILDTAKWLRHFKHLIDNERSAEQRISPTVEAAWVVASLAFAPEVANWADSEFARRSIEQLYQWAKLAGSLSYDPQRMNSYAMFASRLCGYPAPPDGAADGVITPVDP